MGVYSQGLQLTTLNDVLGESFVFYRTPDLMGMVVRCTLCEHKAHIDDRTFMTKGSAIGTIIDACRHDCEGIQPKALLKDLEYVGKNSQALDGDSCASDVGQGCESALPLATRG